MKRLAVITGFVLAMLLPTAAFAGPVISVGDCESDRGKIAHLVADIK